MKASNFHKWESGIPNLFLTLAPPLVINLNQPGRDAVSAYLDLANFSCHLNFFNSNKVLGIGVLLKGILALDHGLVMAAPCLATS